MPEELPCRWTGYADTRPGQFVATCSCGWESKPYATAGLAGAASDEHQAERAKEASGRAGTSNHGQ